MRRLSVLHAWARCGSAEHLLCCGAVLHEGMPGLPVPCSWQSALNLPPEQAMTCMAVPAWQLPAAHQARALGTILCLIALQRDCPSARLVTRA